MFVAGVISSFLLESTSAGKEIIKKINPQTAAPLPRDSSTPHHTFLSLSLFSFFLTSPDPRCQPEVERCGTSESTAGPRMSEHAAAASSFPSSLLFILCSLIDSQCDEETVRESEEMELRGK